MKLSSYDFEYIGKVIEHYNDIGVVYYYYYY